MYTVEYTTYTNKGSREVNEDSCGAAVFGDCYCFVVADGLGGHGGGDVASKLAVEAVCDVFSASGYTDDFFREAFNAAQSRILAAQQEAHADFRMKTTMVILVVTPRQSCWAHIGDSRLYHFKGRRLRERTLDHSVPQMLALSGAIREQEIRHHPDRNRLLRVLGVKGEQPRFACAKPVKNGGTHTYLLCTDGYWELVDEREMEKTLSAGADIGAWISSMNAAVRSNGESTQMDNYTAIAVRVQARGFLGL